MTLLHGVTVWTGNGDVLPDHEIVISDGRIAAVRPSAGHQGAPPGPATQEPVLDLAGAWVLPGLIDLHSHLTLHRSAPERNELHLRPVYAAVRAARENLEAGITTCRDVGGYQHSDIALRDAIADGDVTGPRLLVAGKPVASTGGHIHYFCREADGVAEVCKAVREQVKAGADLIKLMLTGGSANVNEQPRRLQLRPAEVRAAIEEAAAADRKVAAHAHTGEAIKLAAEAGAASVEHAALLDDVAITALLHTGCVLVPTQAVYRRLAENIDGWEPRKAESAKHLYDEKVTSLAKAIAAGVRLGVGTDSGRHFPHGAIVREMEELVVAGFTREQVLVAATFGNAETLGISDDIGSIEPGKRADLIVCDGDPRSDLRFLDPPRLVLKEGRMYKPT